MCSGRAGGSEGGLEDACCVCLLNKRLVSLAKHGGENHNEHTAGLDPSSVRVAVPRQQARSHLPVARSSTKVPSCWLSSYKASPIIRSSSPCIVQNTHPPLPCDPCPSLGCVPIATASRMPLCCHNLCHQASTLPLRHPCAPGAAWGGRPSFCHALQSSTPSPSSGSSEKSPDLRQLLGLSWKATPRASTPGNPMPQPVSVSSTGEEQHRAMPSAQNSPHRQCSGHSGPASPLKWAAPTALAPSHQSRSQRGTGL